MSWTPDSWKSKLVTQAATYPDTAALQEALASLGALPPLVTPHEVDALKSQLAAASAGKAFLLQGGDCAESFADCNAASITAKMKILLQMSVVLVHATRAPVIRVGRLAGQYAKPRSSDTETKEGKTLPTYRGDTVNRIGFTEEERTPDPSLLLRGYERAALTLNYVRALAAGGFSDLHHPENWDLGFATGSELRAEYERIVESIKDSIDFMHAIAGRDARALKRIDFFISHEALSLDYESAQTRAPTGGRHYNLSTHLPWIGMRTASPEGAHVEYCRGIENPIGIKLGPAMTASWLEALLDRINPKDEPGKIVLIARMGANGVRTHLPPLIESVQKLGRQVVWSSDPMHGNTETTKDGIKTRHFDNIISELEQSFAIHESLGSTLGGVHFELTGDDVTECLGGASGLTEADLHRDYRSLVDPRLNYEQALEMALRMARTLPRRRT